MFLRRSATALAVATLLCTAAAPAFARAPGEAPAGRKLPDGLFGRVDPKFDGVWRRSVALLALKAAGSAPPEEAVGRLARQQCADGSFTAYRARPGDSCDPEKTPADTNATGIAVQALAAVGGHRDAVGKSVKWLASVQNEDGGRQAQATDGYRYWSFWERDGSSWSYATQGPSTLRPEDGDVLGFRFAAGEGTEDATAPREPADFASVCESAAEKGDKRVAIGIDFGTAADAPDGQTPPPARTVCARLGSGDTAADALASVAKPLRYDSGAMLCGIGGYPEKGCGEQVSGERGAEGRDRSARGGGAAEDAGSGGLPASVRVGAGIALIAALAAGAHWQARRRR